MRCKCGAELAADARFCVKCGQPVSSGTDVCAACGAAMKPGAKFCGKCGAKVAVAAAAVAATLLSCKKCGASLIGGKKFCGKCGQPVAEGGPFIKPEPVVPTPAGAGSASGSAGSRVAESGASDGPDIGAMASAALGKIKTVVSSAAATLKEKGGVAPSRNARTKQLLLAAVIVSLCILVVGFVGKQLLAAFAEAVLNYVEAEGSGDELTEMLARISSRKLVGLAVSLIRNDMQGFIDEINGLLKTMGSSMGLDSFSLALSGMFMNEIMVEAFSEGRTMLVEEAGAYWPLLQIMAYHHELTVIGLIATAVSAVLLFLSGFKPSEIRSLRMVPALVVGLGFIAVLLIGLLVMGNDAFLMGMLESAMN